MVYWKKRAIEMSMQAIVVAVIALVVLVIVILVFKGQIGKASQRLFGIGEQAAQEANATNKCESIFSSRRCMKDCLPTQVLDASTPPKVIKTIYYGEIPGQWTDCSAKQGMPNCCEPTQV